MHKTTVKPFPKLSNGSLRFVGIITCGRKVVATTLLCGDSAACHESARGLIRAIQMSANRSGLGGWITPAEEPDDARDWGENRHDLIA